MIGRFFLYLLSFLSCGVAGVWGEISLKDRLDGLSSNTFEERLEHHKALVREAVDEGVFSTEEILEAFLTEARPEVRGRLKEILKILVVRERFGEGKGYIGIEMKPSAISDEEGAAVTLAVLISRISGDGPAGKAGLKPGDIIVGVDDLGGEQEGVGMDVFRKHIISKSPGDLVNLLILRDGVVSSKPLILGRFPEARLTPQRRGFSSQSVPLNAERDYFDQWLAKRLDAAKHN